MHPMKYSVHNSAVQIEHRKKQHRESLLTTDAYRTAFEEQLNRNKKLVRQLAEITATVLSNNSKTAKFKAAMKWLLQQLNEGAEIITQDNAYGSNPHMKLKTKIPITVLFLSKYIFEPVHPVCYKNSEYWAFMGRIRLA